MTAQPNQYFNGLNSKFIIILKQISQFFEYYIKYVNAKIIKFVPNDILSNILYISSSITENKPRKPRTLKLANPGPNPSKKVLSTMISLSQYNSDNSLIQREINLVQSTYTSRVITNFKTATTNLDLSTSGPKLRGNVSSNITSL